MEVGEYIASNGDSIPIHDSNVEFFIVHSHNHTKQVIFRTHVIPRSYAAGSSDSDDIVIINDSQSSAVIAREAINALLTLEVYLLIVKSVQYRTGRSY
jgi:hypothetical protein